MKNIKFIISQIQNYSRNSWSYRPSTEVPRCKSLNKCAIDGSLLAIALLRSLGATCSTSGDTVKRATGKRTRVSTETIRALGARPSVLVFALCAAT